MASKIETNENLVPLESSNNSTTGNEMKASTSNPAPKPSKATSSSMTKETKIIQSGERKTGKVVSTTSNKKVKKCKDCKHKDIEEKLKKHMEYFCDKTNNKWWDIQISGQFQHRIVQCDFGKALCRYRLYTDTFTFEIYTDIPTFELGRYKTTVQLRTQNKNTRKPKLLETELEAEYDWKLTINDWKKQDYLKEFEIKVTICLKPEVQSNAAIDNK